MEKQVTEYRLKNLENETESLWKKYDSINAKFSGILVAVILIFVEIGLFQFFK